MQNKDKLNVHINQAMLFVIMLIMDADILMVEVKVKVMPMVISWRLW